MEWINEALSTNNYEFVLLFMSIASNIFYLFISLFNTCKSPTRFLIANTFNCFTYCIDPFVSTSLIFNLQLITKLTNSMCSEVPASRSNGTLHHLVFSHWERLINLLQKGSNTPLCFLYGLIKHYTVSRHSQTFFDMQTVVARLVFECRWEQPWLT